MRLKQIGQFPWMGAALLAVAVFGVTLGGSYIYDDNGIILEDPRIADSSRWVEFITKPYNDGADKLYRPLISFSYAVQWKLHGDRAWVFHLVNLVLHAVASALVAVLGSRLTGLAGGWIAGVIFAVHPVHVEAAANIVGRAELLCAVGMLGAMVLLLGPMTIRRAIAIAGCFLVSVLSKEQGMLVPLLLAGLWWVRGSLSMTPSDDRRGIVMLMLLLAWLLAGYIIWREMMIGFWWERQVLDWTVNPMVTGPLNPRGGSIGADRWLMPLALLGRYLVLLVAPVKLLFDYGGLVIGWHVDPRDPYLWIGIAAIVSWCVVLGIAWRQRNRPAIFVAIALAMTYLMVGNAFALIGVNFAERLMYVPSIFFVLLVTMGISKLPPQVLFNLTILAVILGAARSITYASLWNDPLAFYEQMLAQNPRSIRLHMLLVDTHRKAGRLEEAEQVAASGRALLPDYWEILWQSGVIALEQRKFDEAAAFFDASFRLNPDLKVVAWQQELSLRRAAAASQPVP